MIEERKVIQDSHFEKLNIFKVEYETISDHEIESLFLCNDSENEFTIPCMQIRISLWWQMLIAASRWTLDPKTITDIIKTNGCAKQPCRSNRSGSQAHLRIKDSCRKWLDYPYHDRPLWSQNTQLLEPSWSPRYWLGPTQLGQLKRNLRGLQKQLCSITWKGQLLWQQSKAERKGTRVCLLLAPIGQQSTVDPVHYQPQAHGIYTAGQCKKCNLGFLCHRTSVCMCQGLETLFLMWSTSFLVGLQKRRIESKNVKIQFPFYLSGWGFKTGKWRPKGKQEREATLYQHNWTLFHLEQLLLSKHSIEGVLSSCRNPTCKQKENPEEGKSCCSSACTVGMLRTLTTSVLL